MRVMQRAQVKRHDTPTLPTTITSQRVHDATLPMKVNAARKAIAACTSLPELLEYRDKAEGLAAAVRVMKTVAPDMIRHANEMVADAWIKGGELLRVYSNVCTKDGRESGLSPRGAAAKNAGIKPYELTAMVRVASAPKTRVYAAAQKSHSLNNVSAQMPPASDNGRVRSGASGYSDHLRDIMGTGSQGRLRLMSSAAKQIPLEAFAQLTLDERKVVKAKITEIMELLDEMDRRLKL